MLDEDADDDSVSRSLEAYLLWLFGYVMFNNGHGNSVDKILIPYAQEIADNEPGHDVPVWSWGSAILAEMYHGLCEGCTKTEENGVLKVCPLLLQLWAYERFAVGRPMVDLSPCEEGYYGNGNDDENPTMGTLWLSGRTVRWYFFQVKFESCIFLTNLKFVFLSFL